MLAEPGLWYVHEPFNPNKGYWDREFQYFYKERYPVKLEKFVRDILKGKHGRFANHRYTKHPLMPLRLMPAPVKRVLIKDPTACLLTNYLSTQFQMCALVLFRHPAGFASSIKELGWPSGKFLGYLLNSEALIQEYLGANEALLRRFVNRDDLEASVVLYGALNKVLWKQIQENENIKYAIFEELCLDPISRFKELFQILSLPYTDSTLNRHMDLCFIASPQKMKYSPHSIRRNSQSMAEGWKSKVDALELRNIRMIWEQFEIPLYLAENDWKIDGQLSL